MDDAGWWIVGSGGLIGSAIRRTLETHGESVWAAPRIDWAGDPLTSLTRAAELYLAESGSEGRVVWSAGLAITSSPPEQVSRELEVLRGFSRALAGVSSVTLVSSAGGIFAAAPAGVVSDDSAPAPASDYGRGKLEAESIVAALATAGTSVSVVRPTNVYGPGQNPVKAQGLVSTLVRAALRHDAVDILAPLATARDYVYVDDVADALVALARRTPSGMVRKRIVASGTLATISEVVAAVELETRSRVALRLAGDAHAPAGPAVGFPAEVWGELGLSAPLDLAAGVRRLVADESAA